MNKICINCNNEFETKRTDAKFCGVNCRKAYSRDVTDKLSVTNKPVSVTDKEPDVTLKEDSETREWLIQQFEAEGKSLDEIEKIMTAQDNYYQSRSYYFIPARMLKREGTARDSRQRV